VSRRKIITEHELRFLIRSEVTKKMLINETRVLNEFMQTLSSALPALAKYGPALATAATTAGNWGKKAKDAAAVASNLAKGADFAGKGATALELGSKALDYGKKASDVAGAASKGMQGFSDTTQSFLNLGQDVNRAKYQYGQATKQASGITNYLFGDKKSSDQVQQAMTSMGPDLNQLDDKGIQSVFGRDNPQQMLDISHMINQGNLADAALLYGAMKGLGTDKKVVKDVIRRRYSSLSNLAQEFAIFATSKGEKDNNVARWLKDDGMRAEAKLFSHIFPDI
jgi:hypothetical protein